MDERIGFTDEPAVHALYDRMLETLREADSLYCESKYRWEAKGEQLPRATYQLWMKKPGYARVEATSGGLLRGVLVGDGENFWIYWLEGRPHWSFEDAEEHAKTRFHRYMKSARPAQRYSLAHEIQRLGAGTSMTILEPILTATVIRCIRTWMGSGISGRRPWMARSAIRSRSASWITRAVFRPLALSPRSSTAEAARGGPRRLRDRDPRAVVQRQAERRDPRGPIHLASAGRLARVALSDPRGKAPAAGRSGAGLRAGDDRLSPGCGSPITAARWSSWRSGGRGDSFALP